MRSEIWGVLLPPSQLDRVQLLGIGEAFSGKPGFHLWDITLRLGTECGEVTLETLLSEPTAVGNGEGACPLRLSPVLVQGNAQFGKYLGLLLTLRSLHLTWEVSEI